VVRWRANDASARPQVVPSAFDVQSITARLRAAGCVAAEEEAAELLAAAPNEEQLRAMVTRRCAGEPLAWVVGAVAFGGEAVLVHPGVFVPRLQTEALAREAVARLPDSGIAVDLCTGSGAVAVVLARQRPRATIFGTEIDPMAVACARANGVTVHEGDMGDPLPATLRGMVDVVTGVVPYVPTGALHLLPRDSTEHEPRHALDGGADGTDELRRAVAAAAVLLRAGGSLLLEVGGKEDAVLVPELRAHGFGDLEAATDDEGELRALYCRLGAPHRGTPPRSARGA